jgi:rhodanese-related sulfurtransferase
MSANGGMVNGVLGRWPLRIAYLAFLIATILFVTTNPSYAIPSPDIVVSFFSNSAQLLALLTAVIGGAAVSRGRRIRDARTIKDGSRWSVWISPALAILLFVSLAANVLLWSRDRDAHETRLSTNLTRSSTEAGRAVGDTSLKTLSFSKQINHRQGITSDRLARLLETGATESGAPVTFIDVREPEEWEVGNLSGFKHVRYPELLHRAGELGLKKSGNVLLCHSGNRSSELCEELKKQGIDCSFVIGGYEKWLAEGRPVKSADGSVLRSLRPLPAFPGSKTLLDTREAQQLVAESKALFVDVRYPEDFNREHLPAAVNIPLRKLRDAEIEAAFEKLPKKPIIAPCYDKRSCFYAQILGLRLYREGFDFRGRYTVPHEYFSPHSQRPHVAAWLDASESTVLGKIQRPFETGLRWLNDRTGSLVMAIFLAVALLRLTLLPLTLKGERDQIVEQSLRPRIAELKTRLAGDPQRYKRAIRHLIESNGVTPTRNLVGLVVQVTLLLVLISAVSAIAGPGSGAFLWMPDIGKPDPLHMISISLGVLVFLHLQFVAVRKTFALLAARAAAGAFFVLITLDLSAALNL